MKIGDRVALSANLAGSNIGLRWRGTVLSVGPLGLRVRWDGYDTHYYNFYELVLADRVHMEELNESR